MGGNSSGVTSLIIVKGELNISITITKAVTITVRVFTFVRG
jgi:hypothetical protein